MLRITELRIGNRVRHGDQIITVNSINNQAGYRRINGVYAFEEGIFDGIPLTLDLFNQYEVYTLQNDNFSFRGIVFHINAENEISYNFRDGSSPLKYLHQLQNLYFALTGEELPER